MTKKTMLIVSVSILLIVVIGLVFFHSKPSADPQFANPALNVIDSLNAGNAQNAVRDFNARAKAQINPELLAQQWSKAISLLGPLKSRVITRAKGQSDGVNIYSVYFTCTFEKGPPLYGVIKFDRQKQINVFKLDGKPQQ
ncbi:MAG: hypothetical protein NT018_10010 [Armatimonadetes bacterium]|nr:hypothetical protein [Armatimonadota bacterium]